jgi:hypothetical protein
MIYFIECSGRIKIGFSENPTARFRKINVEAPFHCELLGVVDGDRKTEAKLHSQWAYLRCHGEWFAASKELRVWIQENAGKHAQKSTGKGGEICGVPVKRGDKIKIAKAIGITPGAVSQWHKIPAEYCGIISDITGHSPQVLRPDVFISWEGGSVQ